VLRQTLEDHEVKSGTGPGCVYISGGVYKMRARKPLASAMGMIARVGRGRVFTLSQVRQFAVFFKNQQNKIRCCYRHQKGGTQDAQSV
jgi:hypothetical protein